MERVRVAVHSEGGGLAADTWATDYPTPGQVSRTEHHLRCEVCWGRWWDSGGATTRLADRAHAALRANVGVPRCATVPPRQSRGGGTGGTLNPCLLCPWRI